MASKLWKEKRVVELKAEFESLTEVMKEAPSDKVEVTTVDIREFISMYTSLLHSAHLPSELVIDPRTHSRWLKKCRKTKLHLSWRRSVVKRHHGWKRSKVFERPRQQQQLQPHQLQQQQIYEQTWSPQQILSHSSSN